MLRSLTNRDVEFLYFHSRFLYILSSPSSIFFSFSLQLLSAATFIGAALCFSAFCFKSLYVFIALFTVGELLLFGTQVMHLKSRCVPGSLLYRGNFNNIRYINVHFAGSRELYMSTMRSTEYETDFNGHVSSCDSRIRRCALCSTCWGSPGLHALLHRLHIANRMN